jgi:hypothetical protein
MMISPSPSLSLKTVQFKREKEGPEEKIFKVDVPRPYARDNASVSEHSVEVCVELFGVLYGTAKADFVQH